MANDTVFKSNGAMTWLLGICATLLTGIAAGSFTLLLYVSQDVAALVTSVQSISQRVDRQDARWTSRFDTLDSRLRDVELGER